MIDVQDKSTVVSIYPLLIKEEKPGVYPGRFTIEPSNGEPSLLVVGQSVHHVDVGEGRPQIEIATPSHEMAKSIVDDFINAQIAISEGAQPGVAWLRGAITLSELKTKHVSLLLQLKTTQKAWYLSLVKMADDDWQRYHKHSVISDIERLAARDLGYTERPWLIVTEQLPSSSCSACGTPISTAVIVCPSCRCILKPDEYKKLTFAT